jgi:hypothetical protein
MSLLGPDLSGVVTSASLFLTGHLVLSLAVRGPESRGQARTRGSLEWAVSALALGAAILPALLVAAIWIFGPLSVLAGRLLMGVPSLVGLVILLRPSLIGSAGAKRRLGSGTPAGDIRGAAPTSSLEMLGFAALGIGSLVVLFAAFSSPVHLFDPVFHFAYKGKILFTEGFSPAAWRDLDGPIGRVMTHPTYPPGVPALEVLASYPLGEFSATSARGLMALFVLAPAAWLFSAFRSVGFRSGVEGRAPGMIAALLWLTLPLLFYIRLPHVGGGLDAISGLLFGPGEGANLEGSPWRTADGPSLDGGGDLALAGLMFGALLHIWRLLPGTRGAGDRADIIVAGVLLGSAVLAKNEGLALLAVLIIAVGLVVLVRRIFMKRTAPLQELGPLVGATLIALFMILPWFVVKGGIPAIDESYTQLLTPSNLADTLFASRGGRLSLAIVGEEFVRTFLDPLHWNLVWILFFGYLGRGLMRPKQLLGSDAALPVLFVIGGLVAFFVILVVTPWPLGQLFTTGIPDRLFLQLAPVAIFGTLLIAWPHTAQKAPADVESPEVTPDPDIPSKGAKA